MLVNELYENVKSGKDLRQSLKLLKFNLSEASDRKAFIASLGGDSSVFERRLRDTDPKIRKNAAWFLGQFGTESAAKALMRAYEREKTLYLRPEYLKALGNATAANMSIL